MATIDDLSKMLFDMQQANAKQVADLMESNMKMVTELIEKSKVHSDGGGKLMKPYSFKGEESKYHEWIVKFLAYRRACNAGCEEWLKWSMEEMQEVINTDNTGTRWVEREKVVDFSTKVHALLINLCEGEAFKIVQNVGPGERLEGLRLLKRRFDPKTPGT